MTIWEQVKRVFGSIRADDGAFHAHCAEDAARELNHRNMDIQIVDVAAQILLNVPFWGSDVSTCYGGHGAELHSAYSLLPLHSCWAAYLRLNRRSKCTIGSSSISMSFFEPSIGRLT